MTQSFPKKTNCSRCLIRIIPFSNQKYEHLNHWRSWIIGSNFIRHILQKYPGYKIVNLDLLTYAGNLENLKDIENNTNYKFIKGDIRDELLVDKIVKENGTDIIIHFAAESHVDRSILEPDSFITTNVLGTHSLLKAALNNGNIRFHHVSTDEVFGSLGINDPASTKLRLMILEARIALLRLLQTIWCGLIIILMACR